ncbi:unnamed protein product [Rotaria magnacalcarata]|uniref:Uncharacterized protein n=1 Tax=Rotaria magnacalcarata TaxID=392030 RepID=A0A819WL02_9BILA|nr:unnamed protein product [Rotaria magnacalcarata]CAF4126297.1 unnamed protein product [Rotaria magnacalcarata]
MECRLVLNNRTDTEITNKDMNGRFHQQLKYYKYRRVPSKNGKAVFYLFFRKEEETYAARRAAKAIREISLVRYYPSNPIDLEPVFRPFPPQKIVDVARYAFRDRLDSFYNVSKKVIIHTEILSSDKDENEHDEPKLQSVNKSANDQIQDIYIIHDLAQWLKPTFEEIEY